MNFLTDNVCKVFDRRNKNKNEARKKFLITLTCCPSASVFVSRPTGLRTSNVSFTSVRVDWNPVPERFILGYRVLVQNTSLNWTLHWNKTYANIVGLRSSTEYIIRVLPVHGLTDVKHPSGNAASILVTTKREPGKQFLGIRRSPIVPKFPHRVQLTA